MSKGNWHLKRVSDMCYRYLCAAVQRICSYFFNWVATQYSLGVRWDIPNLLSRIVVPLRMFVGRYRCTWIEGWWGSWFRLWLVCLERCADLYGFWVVYWQFGIRDSKELLFFLSDSPVTVSVIDEGMVFNLKDGDGSKDRAVVCGGRMHKDSARYCSRSCRITAPPLSAFFITMFSWRFLKRSFQLSSGWILGGQWHWCPEIWWKPLFQFCFLCDERGRIQTWVEADY